MSTATPTTRATAAPLTATSPEVVAIREKLRNDTASQAALEWFTACRLALRSGMTGDQIALLIHAGKRVTTEETTAGVVEARQIGIPAGSDEAERYVPQIDADDLFGEIPVMRDMMRHVAGEVVCPPDLPILTALALFSAAVAVKAVGDCAGWKHPPNLYIAAEVASGENKTRVRKMLGGNELVTRNKCGVTAWYEAVADARGGQAEALKYQREAKVTRLRALAKSDGDHEQQAELGKEIAVITRQLADLAAVRPPQSVVVGCITPEQFVREQGLGGFVAIVADEGRESLLKFSGNGSTASGNLPPFLSAFSGEPSANLTIDATKREDVTLFRNLHATVWLPLQPGVLTPTTPDESRMLANLGTRGALARLLIARPRPVLAAEAPAIREAHAARGPSEGALITADYAELFKRIVHGEGAEAQEGDGIPERRAEETMIKRPHPLVPARPWVFTYTPDAAAALFAYQRRTQDSARPDGTNTGPMLAEFAARLADHAHRLATLLAILRHGRIEGGGTVTASDVGRVVRFLDGYALPHALDVYARARATPLEGDAARVLRVVAKRGQLTRRELQLALGVGWAKAKGTDRQERLDDALDMLEADGRIHRTPGKRKDTVIVSYIPPMLAAAA